MKTLRSLKLNFFHKKKKKTQKLLPIWEILKNYDVTLTRKSILIASVLRISLSIHVLFFSSQL